MLTLNTKKHDNRQTFIPAAFYALSDNLARRDRSVPALLQQKEHLADFPFRCLVGGKVSGNSGLLMMLGSVTL